MILLMVILIAKSGWTGPDADKYHELLEKAAMSTDNKERAQLFYEAEKLLVGTGLLLLPI